MKYWRGYLTAAILGLITWALIQLGGRFTELVDLVYPYLTRTVQNFLASWSGGVNFCVWQVAAVLLGVAVLTSIVLLIVLRWNPVQWLGWVLAGAVLIYFMHTCIYGLNYKAGALAEDVRLNVTGYTLDELEDATVYYRDLANELADSLERDGNGDVVYPAFDQLAEQAGEGFRVLTYERGYPIFAGSTVPVKELGWAGMYTSMGITGFTMPLTGEAAVNPEIPAVGIPFTMCHEMAHRMCIALERDANFAAFLASSANPEDTFRYSAYFMAYRYCYSALSAVKTTDATVAIARIAAGERANLKHDIAAYAGFFADNQKKGATDFATAVNDTYIKTSGDEKGVASYGEVCDLLVNWHIQEVVLPAQQQEAESTFDPYDESQVDLSDIVGALGKTAAEED